MQTAQDHAGPLCCWCPPIEQTEWIEWIELGRAAYFHVVLVVILVISHIYIIVVMNVLLHKFLCNLLHTFIDVLLNCREFVAMASNDSLHMFSITVSMDVL